MAIVECVEFDYAELLALYQEGGMGDVALVATDIMKYYDGKTYRVQDPDTKQWLVAAIAFCDGGKGKTDLVVAGFVSEKGVEQISQSLVDLLTEILHENPGVDFDLVSFPCITKDYADPQMTPFSDQRSEGYRPVMSLMSLSSRAAMRIRLAHDARSFERMNAKN